MTDIFLSYAKLDLERVRPLVERLEEHGWSVWWDREIPPGQTWPQLIAHGLAVTKVMIVVWSEASVKSKWVEIEATKGEERGAFIPVAIDPVEVPLQFSLIQAADLTAWDPSEDNQQLQKVIQELERILGVPTSIAEPVVEQKEMPTEHPVEVPEGVESTSPTSKPATETRRKQRAETATETKHQSEEGPQRQVDKYSEQALSKLSKWAAPSGFDIRNINIVLIMFSIAIVAGLYVWNQQLSKNVIELTNLYDLPVEVGRKATEETAEKTTDPRLLDIEGERVYKVVTPSLLVPDNNAAGAKSSLTIENSGVIRDFNVSVDITTTYRGDVETVLVAPWGERFVLHYRKGSGGDDLIATYGFDTTPSLQGLLDKSVAGNWTLEVRDLAYIDKTILNQWSIEAIYNPGKLH